MTTSIRWRIAVPYTLVIVLTTLGLAGYISGVVRRARLDDLQTHLLAEARWMASYILDAATEGFDETCIPEASIQEWVLQTGERVTLIDAKGNVIFESHAERGGMDNHLYRPEIRDALREGEGMSTRFSRTLQREVMYAAVAVREEDDVQGFVRLALPLDQIEANVNRLSRTILVSGLILAVCASLLAVYLATRTISPIQQLTQVVGQMAEGNLSARLLPTTRDEVGQLTHAFNAMADQLHEKVTTLAEERAQLSAVLETMADGVIITDHEGQVVLINHAAERILHSDPYPSGTRTPMEARIYAEKMRTFAQAVYNHELITLWEQCRESGEEQIAALETVLHNSFLQVIVTPLPEMDPPGYLVILQDLTQVRHLETVRRDFISNISHELRTPLASLALVVETLKDGAIEDPPAAERFLSHMESEVSALVQMVEELLELARIESGKVPLDLQPTRVEQLIQTPVQRLQPQAERKGITLSVELSKDLPPVYADAVRIHQVIGNLMHNAVKFTEEGGGITLRAWSNAGPDEATPKLTANEVTIAVSDTGSGIPADDVPRIFERFYKVEQARAGGGTGLGLAIAKHIVQGHKTQGRGGRIWVESIEGEGSTFYFTLPAVLR